MSWQAESKNCKLSCPWMNTHMCVLAQLSPEMLADHHVSLGVFCGLKSIYEPHPLPPCITEGGFVEWRLQPALAEAEAAKQRDELGPASIQ